MKVILKEVIETLGMIGEVVRVSPGYARNFLFPRDVAIPASTKQVKQLEHHKRSLQRKLNILKKEKEVLKGQMESLTITIRRKAGENNKLFGSVTNQDIHKQLQEKGVKVQRKQIELAQPIKSLGAHKVPCHLMDGVVAQLNVAVVTEV